MKEMFADETSLKLLSKSNIFLSKTFILYLMIQFEYFLTVIDLQVLWSLVNNLFRPRYFADLLGNNWGRPPSLRPC